jgi:CPA1 family monovalent cation:H+ antiporter
MALAHLEEIRGEDQPEFAAVYDDISHHYSQRLAILNRDGTGGELMSTKELDRYRAVTAELIRLERKTAVRLRNEGRIGDEVLRKIEYELDLSETRLALS